MYTKHYTSLYTDAESTQRNFCMAIYCLFALVNGRRVKSQYKNYFRYKATINRINEEDSNKIVGFSRPAQPTKQSEIPAQYIPRDPGSPSRGVTPSRDVTSPRDGTTTSDGVESPLAMTSSCAITSSNDVELCSVTSPISVSPISVEGCKRESSCSDSGVDVTSLSIC